MSNRNLSGPVHPTIFLTVWIVLGFGLERLCPLELPGASLLQPLKFILCILGVALFGGSALELRRSQATLEHKGPTTALATKGPYRISRNPIYLALILILVAMALDGGSVWFLVLTFAFWGAVQWLTVVREESYLERKFGDEYLQYKGKVRQWL